MTRINALLRYTRGLRSSSQCISSTGSSVRHLSNSRRIYRENDIVLLKSKSNDRSLPILTKPLRIGDKFPTGATRDSIAAEDIIGKAVRDVVSSTKGNEYRIHEPSIAEYTDYSPRIVTPIYSQDANLIVSLLDLHPSTPDADNGQGQDSIEIFEAGTGHGALTLNLARAIHGANMVAPPIPDAPKRKTEYGIEAINDYQEAKAAHEAYEVWQKSRRAVIHTLDQSASFSAHARKTVRNFRRGMYYPNIDFHVGSIDSYLSERLSQEIGPFLDHAILDLPNTHKYFEIVGQALKANGSLVTWCPSITQINKCIMLVKEEHMPLVLEKVIEVGQGLSGGRDWDVKMVKPRATMKVKVEPKIPDPDIEVTDLVTDVAEEDQLAIGSAGSNDGWEMVCRPKVGVRVIGGGFIALWRKMER